MYYLKKNTKNKMTKKIKLNSTELCWRHYVFSFFKVHELIRMAILAGQWRRASAVPTAAQAQINKHRVGSLLS